MGNELKNYFKKTFSITLIFLLLATILQVQFTNKNLFVYASNSNIIDTIAGTGIGDGGLANDAKLDNPDGVAVDSNGNIYIADYNYNRIRKIDTSGVITTIAGTGNPGYSGDGGPATNAQLNYPRDVAVDSNGNIYIADTDNHRIRKIDSNGIISTVAGNGSSSGITNNVLATSVALCYPCGIAIDSEDNIYIADTDHHMIRKVDANTQIISKIAGSNDGQEGYSGDGGLATLASFRYPCDVAVDNDGNIYVADTNNNVIRKIDTLGCISTVVTGLYTPHKIIVDNDNNVYFSDTFNHRIQKLDTSNVVSTIVGTGIQGYSGDGGLALNAKLKYPSGLAIDSAGNVYVADNGNNRIRKIDTSNIISTIAGRDNSYNGDGIEATKANLNSPYGVEVNSDGSFYITEFGNNRIRKVDINGNISTIAGTGVEGYSGNGGLAINAELNSPVGITLDNIGNIYFVDYNNHCIRMIDINGIIHTIAGTGNRGYSGDEGLAINAELNNPCGVTLDDIGNIYIADLGNHCIRKVDINGYINTIAGTGVVGYSGDGGSATSAKLFNPFAVVTDNDNIYIADTGNHCIRKVDINGNISTIAGTGVLGYSGDGGSAIDATLYVPKEVALDNIGNIYITDTGNHCIRKIDINGNIRTIVGTGVAGYSGDSGPATGAALNLPCGIDLDNNSNIYIADTYNHLIRKAIVIPDTLTGLATITGNGIFGETLAASLENNNNTGILSYQWLRNGLNITGATNSTYTLSQDDIGKQISVDITSSYETGTVTTSKIALIEKANSEASTVKTPELISKTYKTVTLKSIEGYEYTVVENNADVSTGVWQDSNIITGLSAKTDYDFYQRIKETETHKASIASEKLDVATKSRVIYIDPSPTPKPIKNDDGSVTIPIDKPEIDKQTNQTKVELSPEEIENAFEQATENEDGKKKLIIKFSTQEGTEGYQIILPKSTLENHKNNEIEIITNIGSVTLPCNLLSNQDSISSDKIMLIIKIADKEQLKPHIREKIGDRPVIELELIQDGQHIKLENSEALIKVSLPYTPTEKELKNPERLVVLYIDGEGKATKICNGKYNTKTGMVEFKIKHFGIYGIVYDEITFKDLGNHLWAKHQIEILAAKGITNGTGNDNFSPNNNITRGDFLTLLIRTLELDKDFETNFDDVNETEHYYEAVGIAKELGITTGVGNNKFNPEAFITREDMIVMAEKALVIKGLISSETDQTILDSFTDKSQISNHALKSISILVENNLITGSNNMINPKGNTTRAQSAVVIYRIYNLD